MHHDNGEAAATSFAESATHSIGVAARRATPRSEVTIVAILWKYNLSPSKQARIDRERAWPEHHERRRNRDDACSPDPIDERT